jgi:hypothetical protein
MRRIITFLLACIAVVAAQGPVPARPDAAQITQLFGPGFHPVPGFPVLTADLDGDGAEDAVAVATADDPMLDQDAFHYKVIDPYSSSFGIGDPRITSQFSAHGDKPRLVLVVHNWRAPKAKFVILNLSFEKLSISRTRLKKKTVPAILAEEAGGFRSLVFWDGKKWKWEDGGISD